LWGYSKSDLETARSLPRVSRRLGIPERLKLDNWFIHRMRRRLPIVVWVCLALGVTPVLCPSPSRGGRGRGSTSKTASTSASSGPSTSAGWRHLCNRMARFERFHNADHRYAALNGATPDEASARLGFMPQPLAGGLRDPDARPRHGQVELIRLIRSDRMLHVLGEEIVLGATVRGGLKRTMDGGAHWTNLKTPGT
jgi:hypothetical protein